jgi:hypothetical protein
MTHPSPVLGGVGIPRTNSLSAVALAKPAHPFAENAKGWVNLNCESRKGGQPAVWPTNLASGHAANRLLLLPTPQVLKNETLSEKAEKAGRESLG